MYYVFIDDEAKGPFSFADIRNMLSSGTITTGTLMCKAGEENWAKVGDLLTANSKQQLSKSLNLTYAPPKKKQPTPSAIIPQKFSSTSDIPDIQEISTGAKCEELALVCYILSFLSIVGGFLFWFFSTPRPSIISIVVTSVISCLLWMIMGAIVDAILKIRKALEIIIKRHD